jgi:hypothetical protein
VLRFLLGFVLALATVAGGAYLYLGKEAVHDPCLGRCGDGTRCLNARCVLLPATAPAPEPKPGHRRHRPLLGNNGVSQAEPEKKLQPGDEKIITSGDALGRPQHLDLSKGGDEKELDQSQIDQVWSSVEPKLSRCITEAVGDWPLESGKIEVSYRIEADGSVHKVRLVAPQLLMRNGLYACMREKILGLHFPRAGSSSVVTFPFQLQ